MSSWDWARVDCGSIVEVEVERVWVGGAMRWGRGRSVIWLCGGFLQLWMGWGSFASLEMLDYISWAEFWWWGGMMGVKVRRGNQMNNMLKGHRD